MEFNSTLNTTYNETDPFWEWRLPTSVFGETRVMAGMVVAGFCVLFFLIIYFWQCCGQCCVRGNNKITKQKFSSVLPWVAFLMVLYFGLEFANSVLLIIGQLRVIQYYPSLIALDFLSLFADSALLSFLLISLVDRLYELSGKDQEFGWIYKGYCWVVGAIAVANVPAFFWQGVKNIIGPEAQSALEETGGVRFKILGSYQALNVSFYGVYMGGVFILTWVTARHLQALGRARVSHKTLTVCISILLASLYTRTIAKFVYAILYVLQDRVKSPNAILLHTIFYGLLSVIIFAAVMVMARLKSFNHMIQSSANDIEYILMKDNPQRGAEYKSVPPAVHIKGASCAVQETQEYKYDTPDYDHPSNHFQR